MSQKQITSLSNIFQPDRADLAFDPQTSVFFWHNKQALAGKSPIRLYVDPRNRLGQPVTLKDLTITFTGSGEVAINQPDIHAILEPFLVDIISDDRARGTIKISADGNIIAPEVSIEFAPNCAKNQSFCLKNRQDLISFAQVIFREKSQAYQEFISIKKAELLKFVRNKYSQTQASFLQKFFH